MRGSKTTVGGTGSSCRLKCRGTFEGLHFLTWLYTCRRWLCEDLHSQGEAWGQAAASSRGAAAEQEGAAASDCLQVPPPPNYAALPLQSWSCVHHKNKSPVMHSRSPYSRFGRETRALLAMDDTFQVLIGRVYGSPSTSLVMYLPDNQNQD